MFRDGLLEAIQLRPEHLSDCEQPRHSPSALIKARRSTTFPLLLASSLKLHGISGHDNLGSSIQTEARGFVPGDRAIFAVPELARRRGGIRAKAGGGSD
jgi:hypothetical protein